MFESFSNVTDESAIILKAVLCLLNNDVFQEMN